MLLTANLPIILWVQMVLLIDKVVQPPIKVAAVLLLIPIIRIRIGVVSMLHVGHFIALAAVVEEDGIADGALSLAFEGR